MNNESSTQEQPEASPVPNTRLVLALKKLSIERIRKEVEMHKKVFELEKEFQEELKVFDEKRRRIIDGSYNPTDEECKYEYEEDAVVEESSEKGIPDFWPRIFSNLDIINEMIQEHDSDLINHIVDIRCVHFTNPNGFRLEFEFSENNFINNKVLTKEYYFADSFDPNDPLNYDSLYINRCKGCKIDWKSPSVDLTKIKVTKKMRHRNSNQVKVVEKLQKCDSFFNFFDPVEVPIEEADSEIKDLLASDFDIAEMIRLHILPRAIIYYTGEGIDDDYSEMDEMDEFDEDEFGEEDEEEDEEEGIEVVTSSGDKRKSKAKYHG